jgi:phosphatidylglycerol:prolipoprotein diacylglycerol transferase
MFAILFPNIDPIAINLGIISIRWYGISYVIGIFLGAYILQKIEKKFKIANLNSKDLENLLSYIIIGIVIGGRLGYILFYTPDTILEDFWEIFKIWHGGMSFHGGLIGVIVSIWIFCLRTGKVFMSVTDLISCVTPIGLFFGRIANFVNAELYGRKTDVSWGVIFPYSDYHPRHPSQLYEAMFEGIVLFLIMLCALNFRQYLINKKTIITKQKSISGLLSGVFLVFYSIFRIVIEIFREPDSHIGYIFDIFSLGQILCIPMIILGIILIYRKEQ